MDSREKEIRAKWISWWGENPDSIKANYIAFCVGDLLTTIDSLRAERDSWKACAEQLHNSEYPKLLEKQLDEIREAALSVCVILVSPTVEDGDNYALVEIECIRKLAATIGKETP